MTKTPTKRRISNPFLDSYLAQEIAYYGLPDYKHKHIECKAVELAGRCDDYFNVNMRFGVKVPILKINGNTWMSLTYMEVQSAFLAIHRAIGFVATAGLGLGYYALRAAQKRNVKQVHVYERDPEVIRFFEEVHGKRTERKKITIIEGDVREKLVGKEYDYCFMDVYGTMLQDDVLTDAKLFTEQNKIKHYDFWCNELVLLVHLLDGTLRASGLKLMEDERRLFRNWHNSPGGDIRSTVEHFSRDEWLDSLTKEMVRLRA